MARKFTDFDEQARELEAKAKKLRREKKSAMQAAYADALVKHFPKVKACESVGEIDDYVRRIAERISREHAGESSEADPASSGQQDTRSGEEPYGGFQPDGFSQQ